MSKNFNQNNNERNYNNRGRNNNFNDRKVAKQPRVNPNEVKAPLYLPADLDKNILTEINDVLNETKFNKISIPIGTYRCLIESNVDCDDNRVRTIGYIKKYNPETKEFTIVIFENLIEKIKEQGDIAVELQFTKYKNTLGTITKFNIVPIFVEVPVED